MAEYNYFIYEYIIYFYNFVVHRWDSNQKYKTEDAKTLCLLYKAEKIMFTKYRVAEFLFIVPKTKCQTLLFFIQKVINPSSLIKQAVGHSCFVSDLI